MVEASNFDYQESGAWLLGHDMADLLPPSAQSRLIELLKRETDVAGRVNLIGDMPMNADLGLRLLQNLAQGFGIRENNLTADLYGGKRDQGG